MGNRFPEPIITSYIETFDYTRSLVDVCNDCQLDWCDPSFTQKNFPVVGERVGKEEVFTVDLNRDLRDEDVLVELARLDYEFVGNIEGVQFVTKHKELEREHPIVFGSAWWSPVGNFCRPYFSREGIGRDLRLSYFGPLSRWSAGCWFFVRRKRNSVAR